MNFPNLFQKKSNELPGTPPLNPEISIPPLEKPWDKYWNPVKNWIISHRNVSIIIAVFAVLFMSAGTYALINSNSSDTSTTTEGSQAEGKDGGIKATQDTDGDGDIDKDDAPSSGSGSSTGGSSNSGGGSSGGNSGSGGGSSTSEVIGFVGCSNIRDSVQGYQDNSGTKFWVPVDDTYAGGTVVKWGNLSSSYWTEFDQFLNNYPSTKTIWWGLCTYSSDRESNAENTSAAKKVLAQIKARIPGVTIYVSAMNDYVSPHICRLTGSDGPSRMRTLASTLVANEGLKTGPAMGSLIYYDLDTSDQQSGSPYFVNSSGATASNNQTKDDGCHPNDAGDIYLGSKLISFFGS